MVLDGFRGFVYTYHILKTTVFLKIPGGFLAELKMLMVISSPLLTPKKHTAAGETRP